MSDSSWPHGLYPTRLLWPWNSPGKNTGVGCHFLFQGLFQTEELNSSLQHWQVDSLPLTYLGSPHTLYLYLNNATLVVLLSTPTQTSAGGHQSISPGSTHEKSLWMESVLFEPVLHTPLSEKTLTWFQCETWSSATGWQLISRPATHPEKMDSCTESTARGLWLSQASRACCVQSACAT